MNKLFKSSHLLILALLFTAFSCNNDDGEVVATITEINLEDLAVTIDENPSNGFAVGTVLTDGSGTLSFSITSQTPAGALNIASGTGELTVANAALFDFETNPVITASVTVVNAVNPATVTINLTNINEASVQDLTVAIDENPTNGQVLGTVPTGTSGTSNFSIASQSPAGALSIDTNTGELTVADASVFDFETNPVITASVLVDDAENPATVNINLTNVNELSAQDLMVALDENPTDGQVVGAIQVSGGGTLNFSIITQTPAAALAINASTGEITVADPNVFDFETNPVMTATIQVEDATDTTTTMVTVNLNDVDEITVQNLTADIDENPTSGQVIGTIQASSSGSLSYAITFQSTAGALSIDQTTGEITVADASLFDFETTPSMFATISVDNGVYSVSATATITINDVDNIAALLSTSLSNYNAASTGDWIIVTEAEYDNLANNLNNITRAGTTVAEYSNTYSSQTTGAYIFSNFTNTALIPNNGYIIAFKYKVYIATNKTGVKIKQSSTANNNGFSDVGNALPSHSGSSQDIFFVLKGNNTPVTANGYLGFDQPGGSMFLFNITSGTGAYWGSSNASNLNGQFPSQKVFYQGLSTTQMQW